MPCQDYQDSDQYLYEECKEKLDKVTALLCKVCSCMESAEDMYNPIQTGDDPELIGWWENHKKQDAKRMIDEQAEKERKRAIEEKAVRRQQLIDSMTDEQKDLLGLN